MYNTDMYNIPTPPPPPSSEGDGREKSDKELLRLTEDGKRERRANNLSTIQETFGEQNSELLLDLFGMIQDALIQGSARIGTEGSPKDREEFIRTVDYLYSQLERGMSSQDYNINGIMKRIREGASKINPGFIFHDDDQV